MIESSLKESRTRAMQFFISNIILITVQCWYTQCSRPCTPKDEIGKLDKCCDGLVKYLIVSNWICVYFPFCYFQNTDASLLAVISFPAFAVENKELVERTQAKVIRHLKGSYGFRRFRRDGYGTVLEDTNRQFYQPTEIKVRELYQNQSKKKSSTMIFFYSEHQIPVPPPHDSLLEGLAWAFMDGLWSDQKCYQRGVWSWGFMLRGRGGRGEYVKTCVLGILKLYIRSINRSNMVVLTNIFDFSKNSRLIVFPLTDGGGETGWGGGGGGKGRGRATDWAVSIIVWILHSLVKPHTVTTRNKLPLNLVL